MSRAPAFPTMPPRYPSGMGMLHTKYEDDADWLARSRPTHELLAEDEDDARFRSSGELLAEAKDPYKHEFTPLSSSNLDSCAYDDLAELLWVRFKSGSLYEYCSVPRYVFDQLCAVGSPGSYHHAAIRCVYRYEMLEGDHKRDEDCYARTQGCH